MEEDAADAAEFEDVLWHISDELRTRLPGLIASPHREAVLGLADTLLEDLAYLCFMRVLEEDDAVACLHYLWQAHARVSWTDQGMVLTFPPPGESIHCKDSGRFTARALEKLMARAGRPWQAPASYPGKPG